MNAEVKRSLYVNDTLSSVTGAGVIVGNTTLPDAASKLMRLSVNAFHIFGPFTDSPKLSFFL